MQDYWSAHPPQAQVTVLDIDSPATVGDPYATEKIGFAAAVAAVEAAAIAGGATDGGHSAVLHDYHAQLVPPFCFSVVKQYFDAH